MKQLLSSTALVGLIVAAPLLGCAGSGDPHDPGFFTGIGELSSGTYDRRLEGRQQQLNDLSVMRQELNSQAQSIRQSQAQLSAGLAQAEMDLGQLQTDLAGLNVQLQTAQASNKVSERERAELQDQITRLGRQVELVKRTPVASQSDAEKELAALRERYAVLTRALAAALSK
jgi:chromosome segregation ATPase